MSFRKIFSISSKCKLKLLTVGVTLKGEKEHLLQKDKETLCEKMIIYEIVR